MRGRTKRGLSPAAGRPIVAYIRKNGSVCCTFTHNVTSTFKFHAKEKDLVKMHQVFEGLPEYFLSIDNQTYLFNGVSIIGKSKLTITMHKLVKLVDDADKTKGTLLV